MIDFDLTVFVESKSFVLFFKLLLHLEWWLFCLACFTLVENTSFETQLRDEVEALGLQFRVSAVFDDIFTQHICNNVINFVELQFCLLI